MSAYSQILEYLFSLHRFGIKLGLDRIIRLLESLGNPHRRFATLHIGGTNGKGSSAAMVASILNAAGYRVGLYTSPHLVDFRERIQVKGEPIPPDQVCVLTELIRKASAPVPSPTFFEFTTAMAFQYFADQQVDVGVIEVGLGGRFDATNVLDPLGVLITTVAFDHEIYLGDTLQAIAGEKAGIIAPDTPLVLGPMPAEGLPVIQARAKTLRAPVFRFGADFETKGTAASSFSYHGPKWAWKDLRTNLLGRHQIINAANALALLEICGQAECPVDESAVRTGLQHVKWPGRLEVVAREPLVILDGAHNPSAATVLFDFLHAQLQDLPARSLILVVGMMADKNHREFLKTFQPIAKEVILTKPHMSRAAEPESLARAFQEFQRPPIVVAEPKEAIAHAGALARPSDIICVTGSLFLVGEISGCFSPSESPIVQV